MALNWDEFKANLISLTAVHVNDSFHFQLLTSNNKINNHGKSEIKHDHLKLIAAKEKSYTAKTKRSQPKKIIRFKNKLLLMVKTKVAVRSFWSKVIQVWGASLYDMSTVLIFTFLFAYL